MEAGDAIATRTRSRNQPQVDNDEEQTAGPSSSPVTPEVKVEAPRESDKNLKLRQAIGKIQKDKELGATEKQRLIQVSIDCHCVPLLIMFIIFVYEHPRS